MAEEKAATLEEVQAFIQAETNKHLEAWESKQTKGNENPNIPNNQNQDPNKALADVINPFVDPKVARASLMANDAKDFASFYMSNPEAHGMKDQIEKMFDTLIQKGQPHTREDIYDKIIGSSYRSDRTKFVDGELEKRKKQVEAAQSMQDMGGSSWGRERNPDLEAQFSKFDTLSREDQEKLLEGVIW